MALLGIWASQKFKGRCRCLCMYNSWFQILHDCDTVTRQYYIGFWGTG